MTTIETLEERQSGISSEELPASFRDAFYIVQRLGIEYLWIDSLCIIQDSSDDWAEHSARMADIYGNSFLTIAASCSPNSHAGILSSRDTLQTGSSVPFKSQYMREEGKIYFRPQIKAYVPGAESDQAYVNETAVFVEPLLTRAWVLQERILSPRTVNYATAELFWECQTLTAHESMISFLERTPAAEMKRSLVPRKSPDNFAVEVQDPTKLSSVYTRWYLLLEAYTRLQLTYETDKFPAISGLAKEFERQTGDEYVAGIWKGDFHRGLLWRPAGIDYGPLRDKFVRRRPQQWRAPSWSWASWDGPIDPSFASYMRRVPYDRDAHFMHIPLTSTGMSTMDRLRDGVVQVRGFCATVTLGYKGIAAFNLEFMGTPLNQFGNCAILDQGSDPDPTPQFLDHSAPESGQTFECLQIGLWNNHESSEFYRSEDDTLYCILLSKDQGRSSYHRMGLVYLRSYECRITTDTTINWELKEIMIE
jgi:hypothetical protein